MINKSVFSILFFFMVVGVTYTQSLNIVSPLNWDLSLSSNDVLLTGEDFTGPFESNQDETIMNVTGYPTSGIGYLIQCIWFSNCNWEVDVERVDMNWHNDLTLYVRRTSTNSTVSGGTQWQAINTNAQSFFNGVGNRSNIQIQYSISGISVLLPADNYSTQVYYTFYDI